MVVHPLGTELPDMVALQKTDAEMNKIQYPSLNKFMGK